jgi:hypothetical protein
MEIVEFCQVCYGRGTCIAGFCQCFVNASNYIACEDTYRGRNKPRQDEHKTGLDKTDDVGG